MIYKQYGKTGKSVSAVGFGGMRFDTSLSLEENADLVRYACSQGINYFDTAPNYCADQSEDIFGLAFKRGMSRPYFVSTKGMPVYHDTAAKAREAVQRSLERLGVPKIDFYHIWCVRKMEHYDLAMCPGGQYEGLLQCQQEGLIEHISLSTHQPGDQIKHIVSEGKLDGLLLGMNILNFPYRWEGMQAAYNSGLGVVAMNPLAGGMIPKNEEKLQFLAGEGETPTEAALRFVISCPQIAMALNGFTTLGQVDAACRVADHSAPFTPADIDRISRHLSANMDSVCTACGYCDNCPQQIPIPAYMQFYNRRQMFGATDEELRKAIIGDHDWGLLAIRKAEAAACTACRQCEEACTQRLNIVERLAQIAEWELEAREQ